MRKTISAIVLPPCFFVFIVFPTSSFAQWEEVKKLTSSDSEPFDFFGYAVSISANIAVVGAYQDADAGIRSGSAYIFDRNKDGTGNWGGVVKLTASDAAPDDRFGRSVSVSETTVVVGAAGNDDAGTSSGSAYIFERDHGGADNWGEVTKLMVADASIQDALGAAVAISGDIAAVTAPGSSDAGFNSGSAYIFDRNEGGANNWGEVKKLTASDARANHDFGLSITVSETTVIVGAPFDDEMGSAAGAVYVFDRDHGGTNNWGEVIKITASDAMPGDQFGRSVSISEDILVVGAYLDDSTDTNTGSAYVFERHAGGTNNWAEIGKLTASDSEADDNFGFSVSISGGTLIIGSYGDDDAGSRSGSAYIFKRQNENSGRWNEAMKLTTSDALSGDNLGWSVSLSDTVSIIGAPFKNGVGDDSGSAYIVQDTSVKPFLRVPISLEQRIERKRISAVVDHHVPTGYNCNKANNCGDPNPPIGTCLDPNASVGDSHRILAFTGDEGLSTCGRNDGPPGYRQDCAGTPFTFGGAITYLGVSSFVTGTGTCPGGAVDNVSYLNYDGHSGTDFKSLVSGYKLNRVNCLREVLSSIGSGAAVSS